MKSLRIRHALVYTQSLPRYSFFCPFLVCWVILIWSQVPLYADETIQLTADKQFEYANLLFEKKDYEGSASEFIRFVFFFHQDKRVEQAKFKIGLSYFYQKNYENALNHFGKILDQYGPDEIGIQSGLFVSKCYAALNDLQSALNNINSLIQLTDNIDFHNKIYYFLGWLYVEFGDFHHARLTFGKIQSMEQTSYPVESIIHETEKYKLLSYKSPGIAGFLSIFPGGGYLYCSRYNDALISFVINSAMIGAAYESFDKHLNVLGGILSAVEMGFYGGNIYGSISSVRKYNKTITAAFIDDLKNRFNINLMTAVDSNCVSITIQRRF